VQKAPQSLPLLEQKLAILRRPLDVIQNAMRELESTAGSGGQQGQGGQTVTVEQGSGLLSRVFSGTALTLSRFFTTVVILFFMLGSGDRLLRGLVEVLPKFEEKRRAVEIATEVERNISGYLLTITMMNALVGVAAGLTMWLCGVGDPLLWGATAFLLNYIPILGPLTGVVIFFAAGILTLAWPWQAMLPAAIYLLIHVAEGETITPMLLARRFTLNPLLVIVSLFFWHTIWGIPGAFLAVPLLAILKIVCDHVEPLRPLGHVIGS
jgi:predicted PurR-regulated permease PerM